MGEKTVTAMYTSKDDLTPLLYSGKIIKKKKNILYNTVVVDTGCYPTVKSIEVYSTRVNFNICKFLKINLVARDLRL